MTNRRKGLILAAALLAVVIIVAGVTLMSRKPTDTASEHQHPSEAELVAKAQAADKQKAADIAKWSAPKSAEELKAAQSLVGKVGPEPDARFATTEECLAGIRREYYVRTTEARGKDIPGYDAAKLKAMQAACYQNR